MKCCIRSSWCFGEVKTYYYYGKSYNLCLSCFQSFNRSFETDKSFREKVLKQADKERKNLKIQF